MTDHSAFTAVSSRMMELSQTLSKAGDAEAAEAIIEAAARIELLSDDLQNCWGGPFNGQTGRQAIVRELLAKMSFDAIVETGTFRGITTEWFAKHYAGPIDSCEIERLYLLQAAHRLFNYPQVTLALMDARQFLREKVAGLPAGSSVLFYLDAHGKNDFPLVEELKIILHSGVNSVVMIDDFKVPFDDLYAFDDYGPGNVLGLEILGFLKDTGVRIFFPCLPSSEETGAARGVCVLSERLAGGLSTCTLLRSNDWRDWKLEELEYKLASAVKRDADVTRTACLLPGEGIRATYMRQLPDRLERVLDSHAAKKQAVLQPLLTLNTQADPEEGAASKSLVRSVGHEAPRLGGRPDVPLASDPGDAKGLRRIVESQAADLLRLRRGLVASQTMAAERLQQLKEAERLQRLKEAEWLQRLKESDDLQERWHCEMVQREIFLIEEDIREVIQLSRWRRLGQRLGVAKRLPWEADGWLASGCIESWGRAEAAGARLERLIEERQRLLSYRAELQRSRWRRLGQRLGLARRLPWEAAAGRRQTLMFQGVAGVEPPNSMLHDALALRSGYLPPLPAAEPLSAQCQPPVWPMSRYERFLEYTRGRFLDECRNFAVDVIFDIGANSGQFAQGIRNCGYHGQIISFEPLSEAHAALTKAATADPLWEVVDRCAIGAVDGVSEINIAGNSQSSSLLPMLRLHRDAAPESAYQGTEPCPLLTLDSFIERTFSDPTTTIGLKIDTQGYEAQVLSGLDRQCLRVKVIVCEMSLVPLYLGGPSMPELCHLLCALGFRCVALGPVFEDPRTGDLLQVDGIFVRKK